MDRKEIKLHAFCVFLMSLVQSCQRLSSTRRRDRATCICSKKLLLLAPGHGETCRRLGLTGVVVVGNPISCTLLKNARVTCLPPSNYLCWIPRVSHHLLLSLSLTSRVASPMCGLEFYNYFHQCTLFDLSTENCNQMCGHSQI